MTEGLTGRLVVTQYRVHSLCRGRASSVEQCQFAAGMAKEAQCREHAVDRRYQAGRRAEAEIEVGLSERQQIGEEIEDRLGIPRDMPPVRQNLPRDLGVELRLAAERIEP